MGTLLLDKTGTITYGNRRATEFLPLTDGSMDRLARTAALASLSDPTPEGASIVELAAALSITAEPAPGAVAVPFTAQTRMSGVDLPDGTEIRKGAASTVLAWLDEPCAEATELADEIGSTGGTPLVVAVRSPRHRAVLGVVHLKDVVKDGLRDRFDELRSMGIRTVMVTDDNPLTAAAIADPLHAQALVLYAAVAVLVSFVVDRAAQKTRAARRAAAESELIQSVTENVLRGEDAMTALVTQLVEAFGLEGATLLDRGQPIAVAGTQGGEATRLPVADDAVLELHGPDLPASERRLVGVVVAQLGAAVERRRLELAASEIEPIAASDRVRGALLSALSHDLRRPLAAATAAVGGMRLAGDELSECDRGELLETADESLAALSKLVTDLLDVSRLQAGVLTIEVFPVELSEVLDLTLGELGPEAERVTVALGHDGAQVTADPVLLQRALVNLLTNALRYSHHVRVATSAFGDRVEVRVVDHGPGVLPERHGDIFVPFQRLGDVDNATGLGLGLALSRGFVEGKVLQLLGRNPGRLVTRQTMLTHIWGTEHARDTGYLRLYLSQLRKKLEPDPSSPRHPITEPGMGYRLEP